MNALSKAEFARGLRFSLANCDWSPHPEWSVFTQYDGPRYYQPRRARFVEKYRSLWAIARTLAPRSIIELGTAAGSAADALTSATHASYTGYDSFGSCPYEWKREVWHPLIIATRLLRARGFSDFRFIKCDIGRIDRLEAADLVFIDTTTDPAELVPHLQVARTAGPTWLLIDDADNPGVHQSLAAVRTALNIDWEADIGYPDGGWLIQLQP